MKVIFSVEVSHRLSALALSVLASGATTAYVAVSAGLPIASAIALVVTSGYSQVATYLAGSRS